MQTETPIRIRQRWDQRPPHANPIIEHLFRRFEAGATLREIAVDILDDRIIDVPAVAAHTIPGVGKQPAIPPHRTNMIDHDFAMGFITKLVLATAAPGTEYQDGLQFQPADLGEPQNKALTAPFQGQPIQIANTLPGVESQALKP